MKDLSVCPNCHQPIFSDDIYCGACGSQLSPQAYVSPTPVPLPAVVSGGMIKCPSCGFMNDADSSFCERDGVALQQASAGVQPAQVTIPPPQIGGVLIMPDKTEIPVSQTSRVFGRSDFLKQLKPENVKEVSRAHFTITQDLGAFYIQDGGPDPSSPGGWRPSLNRTIINGTPLDASEKRKLQNDDVIDVASVGLNMVFKTR